MSAAARAVSVAPGNGDAAIRFLERRSVVYAVSGHADDVAALLQDIHDVEFMFGKYLGEAVRFFDGFRRLLPSRDA